MYIYTINSENSCQQVLSLLSPDEIANKKLPSETIVGKLAKNSSENDKINFDDFIPNSIFINFLHNVISKYAIEVSGLCAEAKRQEKGWIYIVDGRCSNPQGEVLPEDVIGAFEVVDGQITSNSYQRNSQHLIFSKKGLFKLQSKLNKYLMQESIKLLQKN
jgi:hypothetical protein